MKTYTVTSQLVNAHREELCDFARAHGVDPNTIPLETEVGASEHQVVFEVYAHGFEFDENDAPMTTTVTRAKARDWPLEEEK